MRLAHLRFQRGDGVAPIRPPHEVNDEECQAAVVDSALAPRVVDVPLLVAVGAVVRPDAQHAVRIAVVDGNLPLGHVGVQGVARLRCDDRRTVLDDRAGQVGPSVRVAVVNRPRRRLGHEPLAAGRLDPHAVQLAPHVRRAAAAALVVKRQLRHRVSRNVLRPRHSDGAERADLTRLDVAVALGRRALGLATLHVAAMHHFEHGLPHLGAVGALPWVAGRQRPAVHVGIAQPVADERFRGLDIRA
ncbi:hypothetical protein Henu3_gp63 [Mycobacterium phage Henu3]|uniref:Uncharacterized protein n=1 Tax=Mycobacterium phage Henu3 TaxID=2492961 RepID=A0A410T7P5_9CAUD|nr:hypothetical protein I5G68_gp58 [Mycobacterium phage Henu3]QAU05004.1 hypothetical protein Henu3_gp63 [Mycobacterium phage Henu3]